ncbi:MAG: T9SS type A sorting domain-containing protein, partial [bacterium]|nr:T9SS type A sorting domain-containing protein [bacterium]
KFDGTNWTVYRTSNSGLPDNWVTAIAIDASGNKWIGIFDRGLAVYGPGVGVEEGSNYNARNGIMKVYSNPLTGITRIIYDVPEDADVNIAIYNPLGQKVATLVDGNKRAGSYTITWDGSKLSAGIYFIRFNSGRFKETKKIFLIK